MLTPIARKLACGPSRNRHEHGIRQTTLKTSAPPHTVWAETQLTQNCGRSSVSPPAERVVQEGCVGAALSCVIFSVAGGSKTVFRWYHDPLRSYSSPGPATCGHLATCCKCAVTTDFGALLKWHSPAPGPGSSVLHNPPPSGQTFECHLQQFGSDLLAHPSSRGRHDWLMESDKRDRMSMRGKVWDGKNRALFFWGM